MYDVFLILVQNNKGEQLFEAKTILLAEFKLKMGKQI